MSIHLIFEDDSQTLITIENDFGEVINVGEWIKNGDGTRTLRIDDVPLHTKAHMAVAVDGDNCGVCGLRAKHPIHWRMNR
jgi:hypothetical protein